MNKSIIATSAVSLLIGGAVALGGTALITPEGEVIGTSLSKASEERVVKIGENNVEVQRYLYDKDRNLIILPQFTESYGQNRIDRENRKWQTEFDYWDGLSAKTIKDNKDKAQSQLDRLDAIQVEMDK